MLQIALLQKYLKGQVPNKSGLLASQSDIVNGQIDMYSVSEPDDRADCDIYVFATTATGSIHIHASDTAQGSLTGKIYEGSLTSVTLKDIPLNATQRLVLMVNEDDIIVTSSVIGKVF